MLLLSRTTFGRSGYALILQHMLSLAPSPRNLNTDLSLLLPRTSSFPPAHASPPTASWKPDHWIPQSLIRWQLCDLHLPLLHLTFVGLFPSTSLFLTPGTGLGPLLFGPHAGTIEETLSPGLPLAVNLYTAATNCSSAGLGSHT